MNKFLILNGPNLNLLGTREPKLYGTKTLLDLEAELSAKTTNCAHLEFFQTNYEGRMIDRIHQLVDESVDGIVINPGAWTHTSIALRDAFIVIGAPVVEVHISNIHARESFRHRSFISDVAMAVIVGCGLKGYDFALQMLVSTLED